MIYSSLISYIESQIKQTELSLQDSFTANKNLNKENEEIKSYTKLEKSIINYIDTNTSLNYDMLHKAKAKKILYKKLFDEYISNDITRQINIYILDSLFYKHIIPTFDCSNTLLALSNGLKKYEKKSFEFYENICKVEKNKIDMMLIIAYNKEVNISGQNLEELPTFLLKDYHKLIEDIIYTQWSINFNIHIKELILTDQKDKDFLFIYERFRDFYDDRIILFDDKFLFQKDEIIEENFKLLFYKAIYYSNLDIMQYTSNQKIFYSNSVKYLNILGFHKLKDRFNEFIQETMDKNSGEEKDEILSQLASFIIADKSGKVFMFVIYCYSMMLNNMVAFDKDESKIVFSPLLKCSAREKVFLENLLINLDKHINKLTNNYHNTAIYYNAQVENYVFAELTKSYTKVLYDEQNKLKLTFSVENILCFLNNLNKNVKNSNFTEPKKKSSKKSLLKNLNIFKKKDKEPEEEDEDLKFLDEFDDVHSEFNFSTRDDLECSELHFLWKKFLRENLFITNNSCNNQKIENIIETSDKIFGKKGSQLLRNTITNLSNTFLKLTSNKSTKNYNIDRDDALLMPIDKLITAPQIIICISDGDANNDINSIFYYLINDKDLECVDYYIYKWKHDTNSFNLCEIYGKLLAYIISSREIFKFQSISLLSVGKGCKVIYNCLKEMSVIGALIDETDLIQDLFIIDPSIKIDLKSNENIQYLKNVAGSVFNVYRDDVYRINVEDVNKEDANYYLPMIFNIDLVKEMKVTNKYYVPLLNRLINNIKGKKYNKV